MTGFTVSLSAGTVMSIASLLRARYSSTPRAIATKRRRRARTSWSEVSKERPGCESSCSSLSSSWSIRSAREPSRSLNSVVRSPGLSGVVIGCFPSFEHDLEGEQAGSRRRHRRHRRRRGYRQDAESQLARMNMRVEQAHQLRQISDELIAQDCRMRRGLAAVLYQRPIEHDPRQPLDRDRAGLDVDDDAVGAKHVADGDALGEIVVGGGQAEI